MLFMPSRRDLFDRDVGPDARGSKPGMEGWIHQPDKFGMEAVGDAAWPKTGVTAAAANVTSRRKFRCRTFMLSSLSRFRRYMSNNSTPWARALDRADDHNTTARPLPYRASRSDDPSWMFGSAGHLPTAFISAR